MAVICEMHHLECTFCLFTYKVQDPLVPFGCRSPWMEVPLVVFVWWVFVWWGFVWWVFVGCGQPGITARREHVTIYHAGRREYVTVSSLQT